LGTNYWEGDNAFLLLALNYYKSTTGSLGEYVILSQALVSWLVERSESCNQIVAEGVANMYAALKPFEDDTQVSNQLVSLKDCFFSIDQPSSVAYEQVLDHTVRGALVFGDETGFGLLENFLRTETWEYDPEVTIHAYSAFSGDDFINIEISSQLLLTVALWKNYSKTPGLQEALEKLWLPGNSNASSLGLPYFMTERGFDNAHSIAIIDPTAFMLFYYWEFNPWAVGKKCSDC